MEQVKINSYTTMTPFKGIADYFFSHFLTSLAVQETSLANKENEDVFPGRIRERNDHI